MGNTHDLRHLDAHAELLEEALVGAPELGHSMLRSHPPVTAVQLLERMLEALLHRLPEERAPVIQRRLTLVQVHVDRLEGRVLVAQVTAKIHAALLHVERDQLHRAYACLVDGLVEGPEILEGRARSPQAKPHHVRHVLDRARAGGGAVDDARLGQVLLKLEHRSTCERALSAAAAHHEVLGLVALVEEYAARSHARVRARTLALDRRLATTAAAAAAAIHPSHDLLKPGALGGAAHGGGGGVLLSVLVAFLQGCLPVLLGGIQAFLGNQRRVGAEELRTPAPRGRRGKGSAQFSEGTAGFTAGDPRQQRGGSAPRQP